MSTDTQTLPVPAADADASSDHAEHHSDKQYYVVAAVLAVLTAIEIALPIALEGKGHIYGPALIVLMCIKFFLVASFFMHLRFDNKILSRVFYAGLFLAVLVYGAALSAMVFWDQSGTKIYDDPPPVQKVIPDSDVPAGS